MQRLDPRRSWEPWGSYHDFKITGSPTLPGAGTLTADAILTEPTQHSTHSALGRGLVGSGSGARHRARRRLQDARGAGAEETEVRTAEELRRAVAQGRPHIVVLEHMDLAPLAPLRRLRADWALGFAPTTVQSIRVRCLFWLGVVAAACCAAACALGLMSSETGIGYNGSIPPALADVRGVMTRLPLSHTAMRNSPCD